MTVQEIIDIINGQFGDAVVKSVADGLHPHVEIKPEQLATLCRFLRNDARLKLDLLRCISAVDWPAKNAIEVVYDLISVTHAHSLAVKVMLDRADPKVDSVSSVWPAANWHERETYDLMGVIFTNHPDFRRILMPEDWTGHPLRKDYQDMTEYHGLKINP